MAWDGVYRGKIHYAQKAPGDHVAYALCKRRLVTSKTDKVQSVTCFACLKKLGLVK
jgi:hypothetical protein